MNQLPRTMLVVLAMCCVLQSAALADPDHAGFDLILQNTVRNGLVDYKTIRDKHHFDLLTYLDQMALTNVSLLGRDAQLAYYINLYNASVIAAVLDRMRDDGSYSPAENEHALFKDPSIVRLPGRKMSLNDLENKIIRPTFREPRVHAALSSAARGGSPLLNRAYRAEDLKETLEANMKRFINDPKHNSIDRQNRKLVLSPVFDWYADDFGGKENLAKYVSKYLEGTPDLGEYKVEFGEYDWSLNVE